MPGMRQPTHPPLRRVPAPTLPSTGATVRRICGQLSGLAGSRQLAYVSAALARGQRFLRPDVSSRGGRAIIEVAVRDNNIDQALRALKKKMQREGLYREMRMRRFYEKPSERRAREQAEAIRRYRKLMKKRMERDEL
ncbi:30S ribosomal protein S21 [bacterium HR40]|nr:30S ribosomal protein S21 [bacterium HR40]